MYKTILFSLLVMLSFSANSQNKYGHTWVLGYRATADTYGTILDFNQQPLGVSHLQKDMYLANASTSMSDSLGELLFYSNGCYIANKEHEMMQNGDSIGLGILASSFCQSSTSRFTQSIISLPVTSAENNYYYLFYLDMESPYEDDWPTYFGLAPLHLYYSLIDMDADEGKGAIVLKNQIAIADTLARSLIQAVRHHNNEDWWILMPESHSNCYYTIKLGRNGIDTTFKQCIGQEWGDSDLQGQAVFSPNRKKYARSNFFYGLNIFDFDDNTGLLSNPDNVSWGIDTFYWNGACFSSNSRFAYTTNYTKVYQFDLQDPLGLENNKILIAELETPDDIAYKTKFNQARLAPDGKIYIGGTNTHNHLHVIHHPNCKGMDCNLEQYAIEMPSFNTASLPNMPHYIDWPESDVCDVLDTLEEDSLVVFKLYPNPFQDELYVEGEGVFQLNIYDALGRLCFDRQNIHSADVIQLQRLTKGLYFYEIMQNGLVIKAGKLIKQAG